MPAENREEDRYRFVRDPVVYLDQDPSEPEDVTYNVTIRMDKPLPRESVQIKAALTVNVRLKIDGVRRPLLARVRLRDYENDRAPSFHAVRERSTNRTDVVRARSRSCA